VRDDPVVLRLGLTQPWHADQLFGHLAATAVPGVEEWRDGAYRRTVLLPHGPAIVALTPGTADVGCRLAQDEALAPWVAAVPGRRVPRTVDGGELALRAVLGQQVSTAAARTHAGRLVQAVGEPVLDPGGGLCFLFPTAAAVAGLDERLLALPSARRRTLLGLAGVLADGRLDLSPVADRAETRAALLRLPGIGPWTAGTIAMRALGDPDAFLPGDLGVAAAAVALGLGKGAQLLARAARWSPYRAYAVQHLWGTVDHAINRLP